MSFLAQRVDRNRRDIAFMDGRCDGVSIRPAHDIAGADLWPLPEASIAGEGAGTQEGPVDSRGPNQALNSGVQGGNRIVLLFEAIAYG